jgi:hypothetical protein
MRLKAQSTVRPVRRLARRRMGTMIGADEILAERPFTHPDFTRREADVMRTMLRRERERAGAWHQDDPRPADGAILRDYDENERRHLLVVPDTRAFVEASGLTAVGFFGRPRDGVDQSILFELEEELVARMHDHAAAGLLSYYDIEFVKGAWGNLALFSTPEGPREWSEDALHRRAMEISPEHYHEIRLHFGSIPGRLLDGGDLSIARTKYLDFSGATPWRALRCWNDGGKRPT